MLWMTSQAQIPNKKKKKISCKETQNSIFSHLLFTFQIHVPGILLHIKKYVSFPLRLEWMYCKELWTWGSIKCWCILAKATSYKDVATLVSVAPATAKVCLKIPTR